MQPVVLGPNQPRQFYKGGSAIAALRGSDEQTEFGPEDWVASATGRFGLGDDGLSRLPDGRYLRDVIEADPVQWLGPDHVGYFGADPALLVKLLDAGQRLPVHVHPDRSFAVRHLGSRHGKTEAWVVLGTEGTQPAVYLGWQRDVEPAELSRWVAEQDTVAMLGRMHKLGVAAGDTVLVPAGTVHAIGEGVFSLELQEPTDFSVMLEVKGFDIDPARGYVGLDRELAISCVNSRSLNDREVDALRTRTTTSGAVAVEDVLAEAAKPYFRAQRVSGGEGVSLEASFAVVVATSGDGLVSGEGWQLRLRRGTTMVVPWGAGGTKVEGRVELFRCLPPLPADAAKDDPGAAPRQ
ncbi:MAG TPA: class I mannose-6-phosphate isomerase [Acidimicrobiales bacterium]|nr:class I mannose-6-phosphate isomerase [Acidimicrobiales bacterium]